MSKDIFPTLNKSKHKLSSFDYQVNVIENRAEDVIRFSDKLESIGLYPLKPWDLKIFQVNLGKMCNQTCSHCHVDAGPDRQEIMTRETMKDCLKALKKGKFTTIDLTGGAPEKNPDFRWFINKIRAGFPNIEIIVRSNLTIINESEEYFDLPEFYAENNLTVVSSLPCYTESNVDRQRGRGVYQRSIRAIKELNNVGYGKERTGLLLHLVFNPGGTSLPGPQRDLELDYKRELWKSDNIVFNSLFTITNMPINRFLNYLIQQGKYEEYLIKLVDSFNPSAAMSVMCRDTISIDWTGRIFDCDFNQQLNLGIQNNIPDHISDFNYLKLSEREITLGQHCFGCTAGEGSSCQGALDVPSYL